MTDLEDLWGSLPTGEPPTAGILQQVACGHGRAALPAPSVWSGALAALGGAFVAGTLVSTPPGAPGADLSPPHPGPSPVAFEADLSPAASCEALLATYVDRALGRVTAWGWDSPYVHGWMPIAHPEPPRSELRRRL